MDGAFNNHESAEPNRRFTYPQVVEIPRAPIVETHDPFIDEYERIPPEDNIIEFAKYIAKHPVAAVIDLNDYRKTRHV